MVIINFLLYYLVIIPLSLLPFPMLYLISDVMYVLFYYVIGYRKSIVLRNIRNSFPEKTSAEHIEISKKFYRHLCDLVVESLKIFTISEKEIKKRILFPNPESINKYYDHGKNIIMAGGHYNNWELFGVAIDALVKPQTIGIYKPLNNKFFDEKMRRTRSKYGLYMISTKIVKQVFEEEKNNLSAYIFAFDQSPSNPDNAYWTTFLNQDTAVLFGAERYAREYNYPVVFGRMNKIKRGYYVLDFEDVSNQPQQTATGEIMEKLVRLLEKDIINQPEYWLWSHKRWKHKRPAKIIADVVN